MEKIEGIVAKGGRSQNQAHARGVQPTSWKHQVKEGPGRQGKAIKRGRKNQTRKGNERIHRRGGKEKTKGVGGIM